MTDNLYCIPEDSEQYGHGGCHDFACDTCDLFLDSSHVYAESPLGWTYDREGYSLCDCLDTDIMVIASPFYTRAQYCSPCVPGAGNLDNPCAEGPKSYCLGHDWFDSGRAPYPVYRVSDDSEVAAGS